MSPVELAGVTAAGFVAGVVNAIAGGGSLVSFPALLAAGYPAVTANVTNNIALWPGYASSVVGFRRELAGQRERATELGVAAALGGVLGVVLLLALPEGVFDAVVPWCVIFASLLLMVQPRLSAWLRARPARPGREGHRSFGSHASLVVAGTYGSYFGGGLGVVLLGVLGLFIVDHLHAIIGLKNLMSLVVATVGLVAFAAFAPVAWEACLLLAPASFLGGFTGARIAKVIPSGALRGAIVSVGLTVGVVMLVT